MPGGSDPNNPDDDDPDEPLDEPAEQAAPPQRAPIPLHVVRGWERDERQAAYQQAASAAARDPDAAAYLLDCLEADEQAATGDDPNERDQAKRLRALAGGAGVGRRSKPFDPMRLCARVAKFYGWSAADVARTPWRTLLGYAREADLMQEEEQANAKGLTTGGAGGLPRSYSDASYDDVVRRLSGR